MVDLNTNHAIHEFLNRIKTQYEVNGAILFGSRARQTHQADRDADVAILLSEPAGEFLTTKLAMADIAYDILLETGIRIQPLPLWEEQRRHPETYSNPELLQNIKREGIRL